MSSPLSVNSLDYSASPRLIFTANTPDRKGLAHKSYSIELPYTTNNNLLLSNVWGAGVLRLVSFEATYSVGGVDLRGWLKLTDINRTSAKALFISGNGYLWERMAQDRLRAIDMSDADIVLNKTNVLASETGTPFVLFDLTDRGAFKQDDGVDITDRFPALRLTELLTRIFNHYGVGLTTQGLNGDEYLLFMQESDVRNSNEWKQDNYLEAEDEVIDYQLNTQAAGGMTWATKLELTEVKDEGGNYASGKYVIPETGTYRFKAAVNKMDFTFEDDQGNPATLNFGGTDDRVKVSFQFRKNGTMIHELAVVETILGGLSVITDSYELDTLPVEFTAGDEIELYVVLTATVSFIMGGTQSRFTASLDTVTETNELSRWYGAGSTIEIENVLPDMSVTEFIKATAEFLNMDIFYDDRLGIVTLRAANGLPYATPITAWEIDSVVDEPKDTLIEFATDKVLPPPNQYISVLGLAQVERKLSYSRTYIGRSGRVGIDIPVLWNSGRPTDVNQWMTPPEQKTRGALRILRKADDVSASYVLTYGGDNTSSRETKTTHIAFEELDTYSLHLRDAARVEQYVTAFAKLELSKLQDLTYFKNTITLQDRYTAERYAIQLLQAEQVDGEIFKLTGQTIALYNIFTQDSTRLTADNNTFTGSSGGGSTTSTATPLPADIWQTSTDAQISGLTAKTTPIDADNIVIDDSADTNSKKRVTWANIKATLKTYFDGLYLRLTGAATQTVESVVTFVGVGTIFKRSSGSGISISANASGTNGVTGVITSEPVTETRTWTIKNENGTFAFLTDIPAALSKASGAEINTGTNDDKFVTPKAIADSNVFRSEKLGQINALSAQTLADAGVFLWESSVDSFAKVKTTWAIIKSTLKTYFDTLYNPILFKAIGSDINTGTNDTQYVTPKAIADSNIFRPEKVGQINALTEVTAPIDNDSFVIDDSNDNVKQFSKKKVKWSTLKTYFGLWTTVSAGRIQTLNSINVDVETAGTNDVATLVNITRKTTGTAAAGIGAALVFNVELATGSVVTTSYIISKVSDMTGGSEKSMLELWNGGGKSCFINENNDFEMNALKSVVIQSANGTRYKLVVDNSGNLSTTTT